MVADTRIAFGTSGRSAAVSEEAATNESTRAEAEARRRDAEALAPDDTVDLDAVRRDAGVDDVLDALDRELVGLSPVKERLRELAALLVVDRVRERFGVTTDRPTLHMCFTGNPGTGKTTVAQRIGDLLHGLGYLRRGHLVTATRDDLVGQYVGHTAPKTKEIVGKARGGVLFVDEAYYLHRPGNERDYGGEAIEILLQAMESHRDDLVVVLAGYADRMATFFEANPGMQSRIAHHVDFPDFTADELVTIAEGMVAEQGLALSDKAHAALREYLALRREQPWFAGARSVRNALDRARMRQARRLGEGGGEVGLHDLTTLEAADLRASRVFAGGHMAT
ncbi:AAA family ATPase [Actinomycetospora cinnamomea]|uniref:Putative Rubsico expression protein CbbX n=1 Tax=Actinomycetospora cinnamomea TaxID=663609 RepID=A0A2U1FLQ9_9PSEU|nr:AAA family ATPase [Actinomycetospora cinnamomea]PVZ13143.1 putative Rubsico expression protein CbbX [Actinomycetospora cinnamomea]